MGDSNLFEVIEGDYTYPPFSNFQNDYTYPPQDFQDIEEVVEIVEIPSVMNRVRGAEIIDSPDMSGMSQQDIIDLYYSNNDDYDTNPAFMVGYEGQIGGINTFVVDDLDGINDNNTSDNSGINIIQSMVIDNGKSVNDNTIITEKYSNTNTPSPYNYTVLILNIIICMVILYLIYYLWKNRYKLGIMKK